MRSMLIMRTTPTGCVWQAYTIENNVERTILTSNAQKHGFFVESQLEGYTEETTPGWRNTPDWQKCLEIYRKENEKNMEPNKAA